MACAIAELPGRNPVDTRESQPYFDGNASGRAEVAMGD